MLSKGNQVLTQVRSIRSGRARDMEGYVLATMKKMNCQNPEDVKRAVKEKNISFIQFWFHGCAGIPEELCRHPFGTGGRA